MLPCLKEWLGLKRCSLLMLILLLGLTGCSQTDAVDHAVDELDTEQNMDVPAAHHLPLSGMLEHYNEYDYFNGFAVAEIEKEGRYYYCFTRKDADVCMVMDEEGKAELSIGEQTVSFTASFMPVGGSTGIYWTDLTGDGAPEFIYIEWWGGTGWYPNTCWIFDGATLEQRYWADFKKDVEEAFSQFAEVYLCGTEVYVDEEGGLAARGVVMLPGDGVQQYFGEARGSMIWDREKEQFVLSGPMTVERYEEAEP